MQPSFDILAIGELNVDLILRGDVTPVFGQVEKLIGDATLALGSSTAIFACGAARLGLRVAFLGKVGDDEFGRFMLHQLQAHGVDTEHVIVEPAIKTGITAILSHGNDRAMLTYLGGSIGGLTMALIDPALVASTRHLHIGSWYLQGRLCAETPALFALAHRSGATTSLDPNYDPSEKWEGGILAALQETDVFLPNQTELCQIGRAVEIDMALRNLSSFGALTVAKLGEDGAIALDQGQVVRAAAIPSRVSDTTGAGDTFDAGFVYGFLNGWGVQRSLQLGCVCGSLSTRSAGGTTSQPTIKEALQVLG